MFRLGLCILICFLTVFISTVAAQDKCPKITVSGPSGNTHAGDTMVFTVIVDVPDTVKLGYKWIVDAGAIEEGAGTPAIVLRTDGRSAGKMVQAMVEVSGLPEGCPNMGTESGPVGFIADPPLLAEFDVFSGKRFRAELDIVAKELGGRPGWLLYVISYRSPGESTVTVTRRTDAIKEYLGTMHKIDATRIVFVDGGTKIRSVRIYAIPRKI